MVAALWQWGNLWLLQTFTTASVACWCFLTYLYYSSPTHRQASRAQVWNRAPSLTHSYLATRRRSCLPLGGGVVQQVTFARIQVIIALEAEAQNSQMCQLFGQPCTILQQVRKDFPRGWTNLLWARLRVKVCCDESNVRLDLLKWVDALVLWKPTHKAVWLHQL